MEEYYKNKQESFTLEGSITRTLDLLSLIGKAGLNEVYNINYESIGYENRSFVLETKKGKGSSYHFYDHILTISYSKEKQLIIKTEAQEIPNGYDYYHNTKITITFIDNDDRKEFIQYLNGWNYNTLAHCNNKTQIESLMAKDEYKKSFPTNWEFNIDMYGDKVKETIPAILNQVINDELNEREQDEGKVRGILLDLSDREVKALRKVLKTYYR